MNERNPRKAKKARKTLVAAFGIVPIGDRFDRAGVQIVNHRDVALAFAECLLIDSDMWHDVARLSSLASGDRLLVSAKSHPNWFAVSPGLL